VPFSDIATSEIPDSVTVCVMSCGRLDLLAMTMQSFRAHNRGGRYIISEDSADSNVIAEVKRTYPDAQVVSGTERLGIMRGIDRLYAAVTTPHIFHLEDDWAFEGPVDWNAAITLLKENAKIANVLVRAFDELKPNWRAKSDNLVCAGQSFQVMRVNAHPEFFGWSPNPGLINKDLWEQNKPFGRMFPDQMSGLIKAQGRVVAYLLPGVARHIGAGRNVVDPTMPARPKSRPLKWLRGIKKKLYYAGLRKEPF
jgi:hypothetical protein